MIFEKFKYGKKPLLPPLKDIIEKVKKKICIQKKKLIC